MRNLNKKFATRASYFVKFVCCILFYHKLFIWLIWILLINLPPVVRMRLLRPPVGQASNVF